MAGLSFSENTLLIQILFIFPIIIKVPPLREAAERYTQVSRRFVLKELVCKLKILTQFLLKQFQ